MHTELAVKLFLTGDLPIVVFLDEGALVDLTIRTFTHHLANPIDVAHLVVLLHFRQNIIKSELLFGVIDLADHLLFDTLLNLSISLLVLLMVEHIVVPLSFTECIVLLSR